MLIIRRKQGESILIGEDIELHVVDISPSRVKIGISAPAEVLILRKEIQLARQQNLAAASGVSGESLQSLVTRLFPH